MIHGNRGCIYFLTFGSLPEILILPMVPHGFLCVAVLFFVFGGPYLLANRNWRDAKNHTQCGQSPQRAHAFSRPPAPAIACCGAPKVGSGPVAAFRGPPSLISPGKKRPRQPRFSNFVLPHLVAKRDWDDETFNSAHGHHTQRAQKQITIHGPPDFEIWRCAISDLKA